MNVAHQLLDFQSHFYTEGHFRPQPVRAIRVSGGGLELNAINNQKQPRNIGNEDDERYLFPLTD